MNKVKIGVLYGGRSGEHEVSLRSAYSVLTHLDTSRYEVVPIGIDKQGGWWLNQYDAVVVNTAAMVNVKHTTSQSLLLPLTHQSGKNYLSDVCDVVFPVLHGPLYEDGALQGLLTHAGIPFVSGSVLASAVGMDKALQKLILQASGLPTVPGERVSRAQWQQDASGALDRIEQQLSFPLFVKPNSLGSSVGTSKVTHPDQLAEAINFAMRYDESVLVEAYIPAREIELAVLTDGEHLVAPRVSIPGEIIVAGSGHEFYSYQAKYAENSSVRYDIPAKLPPALVPQAQSIAKQAFVALRCYGMARVDLFYQETTQQFFINEINTLPGFTNISMYPKLWQESGLPYSELLSSLIDLALAQFQRDAAIIREWQPSVL